MTKAQALLALILTVMIAPPARSAGPHDGDAAAPAVQAFARPRYLRELKVTPNLRSSIPPSEQLPLAIQEGETVLTDLVASTPSAFWQARLRWLDDEIAAVLQEVPELKEQLPLSLSVYGVADFTEHESNPDILTPHDLQDPTALRRKLMKRALWSRLYPGLAKHLEGLQKQGKLLPVVRSPVLSFSSVELGPFLEESLPEIWASSREEAHAPAAPDPGMRLSVENLSTLKEELRRARELRAKDPRVGERAYARVMADHFISQMRGREKSWEAQPSPKAASRILQSFLAEYGAEAQLPDVYRRWVGYVMRELPNPEHYRTLVSPEDPFRALRSPVVISFASLLDKYQTELPRAEAKRFAELRSKYGLTHEALDRFEESYRRDQTRGQESTWGPTVAARWVPVVAKSEKDSVLAEPKDQVPAETERPGHSATEPDERLKQIVRENDFIVDRDLLDYQGAFPDSFGRDLLALGPRGHWIDMGSGDTNAGWAARHLYWPEKIFADAPALRLDGEDPGERLLAVLQRLSKRPVSERPRITGVTHQAHRKQLVEDGGRFEVKTGRFLEDVPEGELDPAELITDYFGVLAYTRELDRVLSRYFRLLKVGGSAHLYFNERGHPLYESTVEVIRNGKTETHHLIDWVEEVAKHQGFAVTRQEIRDGKHTHVSLRVQRLPESRVDVPKLRLLDIVEKDGNGKVLRPPLRHFAEVP